VDLQWTAGDATTLAQNYKIVLNVDFNPAANAEQFITLAATIPTPPNFSAKNNPGPGQWSNDLTDFVVSESTHLGFSFWNAFPHTPFNPNTQGEYVVQLLAQDNAGVTIATSLASLLTGRPVKHALAMTGEITLRGKVMPVGGIKEKVLAAKRAGITTVVLPRLNEKDLEDIPEAIRQEMRFEFVDTIAEALDRALEPVGEPRVADDELPARAANL